MRRLVGATAGVAAAALVAAAIAGAEPPTRDPLVAEPFLFPAGLVCPFPVLLEPTQNGQTIKTFSDGSFVITGRFRTRVTNLASGRSIEINNPGPIFVSQNPDGTWAVKGTGTNAFYFFPGDLGPGQPGALLKLEGLTLETISESFDTILSFRHAGKTENLCDTLA